MIAVHRPAMVCTQKGRMKPVLLSLLFLITAPAQATDEDRQEIYSSLLSCAAFHTIEATRTQGDAAAAQAATAYDYAVAAESFVADRKRTTVDAELKTLLADYKTKLDTGEPRAMAEQWTALEAACRELHAAKDGMVAKRRDELNGKTEAR